MNRNCSAPGTHEIYFKLCTSSNALSLVSYQRVQYNFNSVEINNNKATDGIDAAAGLSATGRRQ